MKATELRIGNYIYHSDYNMKDKKTVYEIRQVDISVLTYLEDGKDWYEPIPVNVEILKALGFKILGIYSHSSRDQISYWFNEDKTILNYKFEVLNGYITKRFQFIHELQNFHFALTGTELELIKK